jgi:YHS domain-containing protein
MKSILFSAILSAALLGLGACKSTENCGDKCGSSCGSTCETEGKAAMSVVAVNTTCPYSGNPVKSDVTSTHNGKTIAFCCGGCKSKFDKASAAEKDAILSKAK